MSFQSIYITKDDFRNFSGIDLDAELDPGSNETNAANAFLFRIEERMHAYLDSNYYEDIDMLYPRMGEKSKRHYKMALLEQAIYVFRNSDISTDSGYDPEVGVKAKAGYLKYITLAPNAKEHLKLAGLLNRHIRNKGRGGAIDGFWWPR